MTKLTEREKKLLNKIVNDKYAIGGFSGMIYNSYIDGKGILEELIQVALKVRLTIEDMSITKEEVIIPLNTKEQIEESRKPIEQAKKEIEAELII